MKFISSINYGFYPIMTPNLNSVAHDMFFIHEGVFWIIHDLIGIYYIIHVILESMHFSHDITLDFSIRSSDIRCISFQDS